MKITKEIRKFLIENHKTKTRQELIDATGLTSRQITCCLFNKGLTASDAFSDEEIKKVIEFYSSQERVDLKRFSEEIGRQKTSICRIAKKFGLTIQNRPHSEETKIKLSENMKKTIEKNGHPKGMLGKNHSEKMRSDMSVRVSKMWDDKYSKFNKEEFRQGISDRAVGVRRGANNYSRAKSGTREDLGFFVRSSWEANYARYLNFLIKNKEILRFEYESDTFIFNEIKRGTRSYTPDFKVFLSDGTFEYHEVKGWMDNKSRVKLERMARYYPDAKIVLIQKKEYKSIEKFSSLIENWE